MLIDLGRNDVGRVSAPGSVEVTEQFVIERYSHVMHLSSNVNGTLQSRQNCHGCVAGNFAGGHPIRRTEKSEPWKLLTSWSQLNVAFMVARLAIYLGTAIWTRQSPFAPPLLTKANCISKQAAASCTIQYPRLEWKESLNKGRAIFRAAALAENQLVDPNDEPR